MIQRTLVSKVDGWDSFTGCDPRDERPWLAVECCSCGVAITGQIDVFFSGLDPVACVHCVAVAFGHVFDHGGEA